MEWILAENGARTQVRCLDIGAGSGCITLALKARRPGWSCVGIDSSQDTLTVARDNAERLDLPARFLRMDVREGLPDGRYDIIVSNPPYIPPSERERMAPSVLAHEPGLALFVPENDPLLFYRAVAERGREQLVAGGRIYVETNEFNNGAVTALLEETGYGLVEARRDMQGKLRMVRAVWPGQ